MRRRANAGCALGGNYPASRDGQDSGIVGTIVIGAIVARTSALLVVVDWLTEKH